MNQNITQETLDMTKAAMANPSDALAKSISVGTGLVAYDLQAPAKNLYPVLSPIRNSIPRVGGGKGTATNWRQVTSITGSGVASMPWVPEGQRSGRMSYITANKAAAYVTIGEEDQITMEAVHAGNTFEDLKSTMATRLLQQMMMKEEHAILGGNNSLALGTPATPTTSASGTTGTLPAATYSVIAVALTYEGYQVASLTSGVKQATVVTGADGLSYTVNGGSSNKSAAASQVIALGQVLFASVAPVAGAVAYAWFTGVAGSEKLEAITTLNSVAFSAPLAGTGQAATAVTVDASTNTGAFDGLLTNALGNHGAIVKTLATGTAGTGTALTPSGRGSVVEIDALLKQMWDNYRVSPTVIYMNSQELNNVTSKVLSNASGPLLRYNQDAKSKEPLGIVAGGIITFYYNPFAMNGGMMIPVKLHPYLPGGTIFMYCENLPLQYQSNNVPQVAEVKTREDYYAIDWPQKTRQYEIGVYAEEVLAVYAPFAMAVINNIANA